MSTTNEAIERLSLILVMADLYKDQDHRLEAGALWMEDGDAIIAELARLSAEVETLRAATDCAKRAEASWYNIAHEAFAERDASNAQCRNLGQQLAKAGEERERYKAAVNAAEDAIKRLLSHSQNGADEALRRYRDHRAAALLSPADTTAGAGAAERETSAIPHEWLEFYRQHQPTLEELQELVRIFEKRLAAPVELTAHAPFTPVTLASHTTVAPPAAPDATWEAAISDEQCRAAVAAHSSNRIQGFASPIDAHLWGAPYYIRDLWLPQERQEVWRGDSQREMTERCEIERMRLALTAAALTPSDGWRSIASAPKDGTALLLFGPNIASRNYTVAGVCDEYAIGFWNYARWVSIEVEDCGGMGGELTGWMPDWCSIDADPTHWRPLPPPPALDTEGGV